MHIIMLLKVVRNNLTLYIELRAVVQGGLRGHRMVRPVYMCLAVPCLASHSLASSEVHLNLLFLLFYTLHSIWMLTGVKQSAGRWRRASMASDNPPNDALGEPYL